MSSTSDGHTTMVVVYDPLNNFPQGTAYSLGQVALWLESEYEGWAIGTKLKYTRVWTVSVSTEADELVLRSGKSVLTADGVRNLRPSGAQPSTTRWQVMEAIHDLNAELGRAPSCAEIGQRLGMPKQGVHFHLIRLTAEGHVFREPGVAYSAVLTDAGTRAVLARRRRPRVHRYWPILDAIETLTATLGQSPTYGEVGALVGIPAPIAGNRICRLIAEGLLHKRTGHTRFLSLTDAGRAILATAREAISTRH